MKNTKNERSKYLALLLRHKPELAHLSLSEDGWVVVNELLDNTDFTLDELKEIIKSDQKGRYSFNDDFSKIRANQGHSTNVKMNFKEFIPSTYLYHGTAFKFLDSILKSGLDKRNRQFVHLSQDVNTAINVGKRHGSPVILKIDAVKMYNDGIKFFISENNVVLTDYVNPKYFSIEEIN